MVLQKQQQPKDEPWTCQVKLSPAIRVTLDPETRRIARIHEEAGLIHEVNEAKKAHEVNEAKKGRPSLPGIGPQVFGLWFHLPGFHFGVTLVLTHYLGTLGTTLPPTWPWHLWEGTWKIGFLLEGLPVRCHVSGRG